MALEYLIHELIAKKLTLLIQLIFLEVRNNSLLKIYINNIVWNKGENYEEVF